MGTVSHLETTSAALNGGDVHLSLLWFHGFTLRSCLLSRDVRVAHPGCRPARRSRVTHLIRAIPFDMLILLAVETPTKPLCCLYLLMRHWSSQL
ncbi:hypothetical protein T07_14824 [Trichinella nelsoni]|uniref:Uncharacterized protein n=1 Tax=Trichinella nelsoni TaxID=6336 RepID=A0A0V0S7S0_9BILA|nr:hypothetical protein T07_14824 [Trichinella nelsoni]